ncbi:MAG: SufD family Fe-S cluster assembly protein [Alphaproteobacteria bacterium]|nr:SufD family Fe-S cluster assembly protein [Alphaproteobacteria bacterium]
MWNNFNIKTFPSETLVYVDGIFRPEFSTLDETEIFSKKYDLPIHIIYTGKIERENTLNINIIIENQPVFLTVDVENNFPGFLNIFIKNAGKNSELRGHIMVKNYSDFACKIITEHDNADTGILLQTKIIGYKNSYSKISATAIINKNCPNTKSDIRLAGYTTDKSAKIRFIPSQRIKSVPNFAEHSAYMMHITEPQENYLRSAGLSGTEVKETITEAFIKDFNLF